MPSHAMASTIFTTLRMGSLKNAILNKIISRAIIMPNCTISSFSCSKILFFNTVLSRLFIMQYHDKVIVKNRLHPFLLHKLAGNQKVVLGKNLLPAALVKDKVIK